MNRESTMDKYIAKNKRHLGDLLYTSPPIMGMRPAGRLQSIGDI